MSNSAVPWYPRNETGALGSDPGHGSYFFMFFITYVRMYTVLSMVLQDILEITLASVHFSMLIRIST